MAQDSKTQEDSITTKEEIVLSHNNICHPFNWQCKQEKLFNKFFNADFGTMICSNDYSFRFQLSNPSINEKITTVWYLKMYPNGWNNSNPKGDCVVGLAISKLPRINMITRKYQKKFCQ